MPPPSTPPAPPHQQALAGLDERMLARVRSRALARALRAFQGACTGGGLPSMKRVEAMLLPLAPSTFVVAVERGGFHGPGLASLAESLPREDLQNAPFGVIRLDAQGNVEFFNETEARLSGYGRRPTAGRSFFTEIAPCMNRADLIGRLERARAGGTLDITCDHFGDFDDATRALRVRVQTLPGGAAWTFIDRR